MLILTRRVGETLMIGDEVSVTVLGVKGNKSDWASMRQKTLPYTVKRFIKEFCMNELGMNGLGMNAWVMIITQSILPPIIEWVKTAVVLG